MERIVLASASPRRKQLLSEINPHPFVVFPVDIAEKLNPIWTCNQQVMDIAKQKALAAFDKYKIKIQQDTLNSTFTGCSNSDNNYSNLETLKKNEFIILGADTLVFWRGKALGKPKDRKQARFYLKCLSGSWHTVLTSLCLIRSTDQKLVLGIERSKVLFRILSEQEIRQYIETGEPMDKAGAYGIQDIGKSFVQCVHGNLDNVVGFPRTLLNKLLNRINSEQLPEFK